MSYDYKYVVEAPDGCQFEYAFQDAAEKLAKDVTRLLEACQ